MIALASSISDATVYSVIYCLR